MRIGEIGEGLFPPFQHCVFLDWDDRPLIAERQAVKAWLREAVGDEGTHWRYLTNTNTATLFTLTAGAAAAFVLRWRGSEVGT